MALAIQCPHCRAVFSISDDVGAAQVACPMCRNVFQQTGSNGIQAGLPKASKPAGEHDEDEPARPSPPHASPRVPFPTVPLLILACGLLFLLLVLSIGFNIWIIATPEVRQQPGQQAIIAQQQAQLMQAQAAAAAEQAKAQAEEAKLKRQIDDLKEELEQVRRELDLARRKLGKTK